MKARDFTATKKEKLRNESPHIELGVLNLRA
jgi:hypothetical protein